MHIHVVIPFCFWMLERRICSLPFLHKIGCHGNVPWDIGKIGLDRSSARKALWCGEKNVKIGPVNPEMFGEIRRTTTWTRSAILIRMFSAQTTGPILQSARASGRLPLAGHADILARILVRKSARKSVSLSVSVSVSVTWNLSWTA